MYNKYVLKNGLSIVTEYIPHVKSVAMGVWIETGSRSENKYNNGISHFIEHMLFKGTQNRTAMQIAESIDNIGGQLNAFTSKECTCFYAKVLDNHISIAIDVLSDMIFNSKFDEEDVRKEKSVIIEEINMYEDSPEDLAHDLLANILFGEHPLAFPILGESKKLEKLTRKDIIEYFHKYYTPDNAVIAIVGNFDEKEILKMLDKHFGHWKGNKKISQYEKMPQFSQKLLGKNKPTEQLHLYIGMEGISENDEDLYSLLVLNNIFGGSMSSRLFQKIREEKGLVYSIDSYPSSYKDVGIYVIYAGLNPSQIINVSKLIMKEFNLIKNESLQIEEILKSKEQLKGNLMLGLESTSSRMNFLGKSELLLREIHSTEEILNKIDNVTIDSINNVIKRVFNVEKMNIAFVGNLTNPKETEAQLRKIYFQ